MADTYDLIAIGSGPAGESATELAAFFGHRCAVIERARPGGTVTTTGGAPTKTLREAALYFSGLVGMPEVSGAGLTEEQCRKLSLDYEVGRADLARTPRGAIAGRGGRLKLIFQKEDRKLVGVHCIGDIASEIVGIGQMTIRCGGTINTIANMSLNTPTYSYAYKYAAFDGLRRLAGNRETSTENVTGRFRQRQDRCEERGER